MTYPGLCMKFGSGVTLPVGYLAPPLLAVAFNAASTHFGGGHFNVPQVLGNAAIGMGAAFAGHELADRLLRCQHAGITRGFKTVSRVQAGLVCTYALVWFVGFQDTGCPGGFQSQQRRYPLQSPRRGLRTVPGS